MRNENKQEKLKHKELEQYKRREVSKRLVIIWQRSEGTPGLKEEKGVRYKCNTLGRVSTVRES